MQRLIRFVIPILLVISIKGYSQDKHFTNFRMAPLAVNPALTGAFEGTYRLTGVYRAQWTSVTSFGNGYKTPHISIDIPILGGLLMKNDWIGVGISIVSDNAGFAKYRSGFAGTSATYHMGMDDKYSRVFSIGFQYGRKNQKFSGNDIRTPSVLVGGPKEPLILDNEGNTKAISNGYIGIGVTYKATLNDEGDLWRAGLALKGIGSSKGSFLSIDSSAQQRTNLTKPTLVGFTQASMIMTEKVRINPAVIFQTNSGFVTLEAQATADYLLNAKKRQIITAGLGYRIGDSINLLAGMQIKDLKIGLAYDITVSGFSAATRNGGFEISVGYIGKIFKKPDMHPIILCPRL
ncbi:MAG: PorP/SprF family type IX secretion system membrane protein [Saprospiraceae bacterium]